MSTPLQTTEQQRLASELEALRGGAVNGPGTLARSMFFQLSPGSQLTFLQSGGKVVDDAAPAKVPLPEGAIRRSAFDAMTPAQRHDFILTGRSIVDDHTVVEDSKEQS